ncbi:hypothetical protein [Spiroplasma clarkii]|uniref:hypothetical protein n=1 Tax=Spiroplasma clarkii TaxID=2139 RepID=UPI0011BABE97|nr:hypothetical protein [Spiroplasma clarkii]
MSNFSPSVENYVHFKEKIEDRFKTNLFFGITKTNSVWISKNVQNVVFANEINFLNEEDFFVQKVLKAIKDGTTLSETNNPEKNYYYDSERVSKYINLEVHNQNITLITNNTNTDVINSGVDHFLTYPNSKNIPSKNYLQNLCETALDNLTNIDRQEYLNRLNYEVEVIASMGFIDYF